MTDVVTLGAGDFAGTKLQREGVWVVDFFASWCAPCKALEPVFAELSRTREGGAHFAALDINDDPEPATALGISSAPTIVIFAEGAEQRRLFGAKTARQLSSAIAKVAEPRGPG